MFETYPGYSFSAVLASLYGSFLQTHGIEGHCKPGNSLSIYHEGKAILLDYDSFYSFNSELLCPRPIPYHTGSIGRKSTQQSLMIFALTKSTLRHVFVNIQP